MSGRSIHRPGSALQVWLIGELRAGMAAVDMTGTELAQASGISQKHISQIMTGAATGTIELWDFLLSLVGRRDQICGPDGSPARREAAP